MKISVIGVGKVGATLAYTLSMRRFVSELVLVGRTRESSLGDALDLEHAQSFAVAPARIVAGEVGDTAGSDVIALCASVPMPRDLGDRLSLGPRNVKLFEELVPPLARVSPGAKIVVLTNPVDVITYYTIQLSGFAPSQVMGTGTLVDSARFRRLLSTDVGIPSGLKELGVKEQDLPTMAENAQKDACGLTNPRCPTLKDVIEIYRSAL